MSDEDTGVGSSYRNFVAGLTVDNQLQYSRTSEPNGNYDPVWRQIGSDNYSGAMSSDITTEGKVAIVASAVDNRHVHFYMEETDGNGTSPIGWSDVVDLGLPDGVSEFSQLALHRSAQGLDSIFGINSADGNIWWKTENPNKIVSKTESVTPPGADEPIEFTVDEVEPPDEVWSDWMALPEKAMHEIFVRQNADDTIVIAGRGKDNKAVYISQQNLAHPQSNTDWLVWNRFDNFNTKQVVSWLDLDMRMSVFALDDDDPKKIYQIRQSASCSNDYAAPNALPEAPEALDRIKVHEGQNGCLYLIGLASGTDTAGLCKMYLTRQKLYEDGSLEWEPWDYLRDFTPGGLPGMDIQSDGRMQIYYWSTGADGDLYYMLEVSPNSGEFDNSLTKIGDDLRGVGHSHDLSIGSRLP